MSQASEAMQAYLRLIARQGAEEQVVLERRRLLEQFVPYLADAPVTPESFRLSVDRLLSDCAPDEKVLAITCTREYFYFWLGDTKKIVEITARSGFTLRNVHVRIEPSFAALQQRIADEGYAGFPPSLGIYLGKLFEDGVDEGEILLREQLLKALLYLLRNEPVRPDSFRMMVDAVLLHLTEACDKAALLKTVREYFYYWHSFPHASARQAAS